jgi:response regulator RpfG family c-di-GMP phosphodiesterase
MSSQTKSYEDMLFAAEDEVHIRHPQNTLRDEWNVLVVDDEQGVHEVTKLALTNFKFDGKTLRFLHAYSAAEAKQVMLKNTSIAVALIDVVMETEHAGLDLVKYIRSDAKNNLIRIILRTGQPGQAPERTVIHDYDINDYKEKTELSAQKLYSTILTSLRSYRDMCALQANRNGLENVLRATGNVFRMGQLHGFIQGVLEQLVALLYLDQGSIFINCDSLAMESNNESLLITAATGQYAEYVGKDARSVLSREVLKNILESLKTRESVVSQEVFVGYSKTNSGREDLIYLSSSRVLSANDADLIKIFLQNVAIAYENVLLRDEIEGTQRDIVYMLGESIETRSKETGQHVRRVAEYARIIALGVGLSERDAATLHIAAPLHDFGKIGIPDYVLHKPGKLTGAEWEIMKTHAQIGADLLGQSKREILQAASLLAGNHHEKWDGTGYPRGLKGEEIHIYGRIGALADVFDALGSRRCYKEPWILDDIIKYLTEQRGAHFDPRLVDWMLNNMEELLHVRRTFPDEV